MSSILVATITLPASRAQSLREFDQPIDIQGFVHSVSRSAEARADWEVLLERLIERAPAIAQSVASGRPFARTEDLRHAIRMQLLGLNEQAHGTTDVARARSFLQRHPRLFVPLSELTTVDI